MIIGRNLRPVWLKGSSDMGNAQGKKKETHLITNIVRLMIIAVAIVSLVLTAISITQLRTVSYITRIYIAS